MASLAQGSRASGFRLQASGFSFGAQTPDSRLQVSTFNFGVQSSNFKLQTSSFNFGVQSSNFKLQVSTSEFRLQTSSFNFGVRAPGLKFQPWASGWPEARTPAPGVPRSPGEVLWSGSPRSPGEQGSLRIQESSGESFSPGAKEILWKPPGSSRIPGGSPFSPEVPRSPGEKSFSLGIIELSL